MAGFPHEPFADRFRLLRTFAGGEGQTALLAPLGGGEPVVIKVLPPGCEPHEADLLLSLQHPAIPRLREVGHLADGRAFLLRDFVAGTPLTERLPLAPAAALDLLRQTLEVLAFVHLRSVRHLDLKPGNLVLDDRGAVHLLDFGLGARAGEQARGGTPFFAAPELLLGGTPDGRTDLFALGATMVLALWPGGGRGPDLGAFLRAFPRQPFLAACGVDAAMFPPPWPRLLPRLLARDPARRFADAEEALEALSARPGRPAPSLLRPDPVALLGPALEPGLRALGERDPILVGGDAADRQALAWHCLAQLPDGERIEPGNGALRVRRRTEAGTLEVSVPPLGPEPLAAHLQRCLGLGGSAAGAAATHLLTHAATPTPAAVGALLVELAERGEVVQNGVRWSWPDAQSGRLRRTAQPAVAAPADASTTIEAMAAGGRREAALAAYRREAAQAAPDRERELRTALARGLLAGGEPLRALPLCADLPTEHIQCLLDLGRLDDAAALLAGLDHPPRPLRRTAAQIALLRGDPTGARQILVALPPPLLPAETVTLAAAHTAGGAPADAMPLLDGLLADAILAARPFLRAAALTERFHAGRALGEPRADDLAEAQQLLFGLGHVRHAASAELNLGVHWKDQGDLPAATARLRAARGLYRHVGDAAGEAIAEANLGIVALAAGDAAGAALRLAGAIDQLLAAGAGEAVPLARTALARALALLGRRSEAEAELARVGPPASARLRREIAAARATLATPAAAPATEPPAAAASPASAMTDSVSRELFRTFLAVNRRLGAERDLDRAMQVLLEAAVTLTGGRRGYLLVQRPGGVRSELAVGEGDPGARAFSRSLANRALQLQRTLTGDDALQDQDLREMPSVRDLGTRSAICAPFRSASDVAGAIYVEHAGRAGAFGDRDREHLEVLADQAAIAVDRMLREEQLAAELEHSRREVLVARHNARQKAPSMLGESPPMAALRKLIARVGDQDLPVLITGETGTGKELVANAIHQAGPRRRGPFVAENCSALPAELMERELFGHVQGAFTGADRDRPGLLELAHGGTLFLDEVGDMPPALQARLLRALQEKQIRRIGGDRTIAVDVRVLAATHKDLRAMVQAGSFREDLFFRLAAVELRVPPLRERQGDLELLASHFLQRLNQKHGRQRRLSPKALAALRAHAWPGNVRELEHVLARAFLLADGEQIEALDLPAAAGEAASPAPAPGPAAWPAITLAEAEQRTIAAALEACAGDKTAAAKLLGISRTALYAKLKRHGEQA